VGKVKKFSMVRFTATFACLASLGAVFSHGGGQIYEIDGVEYYGNWDLLKNTKGSIQREWNWNYIEGPATSPNLACGVSGKPNAISMHAPITAGSTISINYTTTYWNDGDLGFWVHPIGPMLAYMAACPDEGCEGVDVNAPIWFKVWQAGLIDGTFTEGYWAMRDISEGSNLDISTPASLKPGKYLLRHEMVNMQGGSPQFFPNCIQLDVKGKGNSLPDSGELVAFPGAYDKDDGKSWRLSKGVEWFFLEHPHDTTYIMPGPSVWQG
jgi:cellulase